jgi:SAM-dependent methyltransferase
VNAPSLAPTNSAREVREDALYALGLALKQARYEFVTVTPSTHARVLARQGSATLRDAFGWNRTVAKSALPSEFIELARAAGVLTESDAGLRMNVRFATLGAELFAHSPFPTVQDDAVFFGPDTYRFVRFLRHSLGRAGTLVDVGCGSGAAGILMARAAEAVILSDINPTALAFARVNARLAGVSATFIESDVLSKISQPIDVVIANPPYMKDSARRLYRDGGGRHGEALSLRIAREALQRLPVGGRLMLYTGAPVVAGRDILATALSELCRGAGACFEYEELDPDVFGDELGEPGYEDVERIAAVGLNARRC